MWAANGGRFAAGGLLRAVRSINGGQRSVHTVPLVTGVVNARSIPTYLRQFLFTTDLPSLQGKRGRSFSLIGIELLFSFINDAGDARRSTIFSQYYSTYRLRHRIRANEKSLSQTTSTLLSIEQRGYSYSTHDISYK